MNRSIATPAYWNDQYRRGRIPWDLGGPTPVFERLLRSSHYAPGSLIVLGAGQGHDAHLFARHGFDVTAVDFAPRAAQMIHSLAPGQSSLKVVQSDIFDLPSAWDGTFDYVLEYTCFCAIHPAQREAYFDLVGRLLAPGGRYVALAFPIVSRDGGPPFAVNPQQILSALTARGLLLEHREQPLDSAPGRRGIEELLVLKKAEHVI
jgi:SAM-dependent methyltransferase